MAARWDNIEILQTIDRSQQERYSGGRISGVNGMHLMDEITGRHGPSTPTGVAASSRNFTSPATWGC